MTQACPLCGASFPAEPRYPRLLCVECARLARDESGRELRFFNQSLSGGFIAEVYDNGTWQRLDTGLTAECRVDGTRCLAEERYFGGIVIQTIQD